MLEGVRLLKEGSIFELGLAADEVRRRKHPQGVVTSYDLATPTSGAQRSRLFDEVLALAHGGLGEAQCVVGHMKHAAGGSLQVAVGRRRLEWPQPKPIDRVVDDWPHRRDVDAAVGAGETVEQPGLGKELLRLAARGESQRGRERLLQQRPADHVAHAAACQIPACPGVGVETTV